MSVKCVVLVVVKDDQPIPNGIVLTLKQLNLYQLAAAGFNLDREERDEIKRPYLEILRLLQTENFKY